MGVSGKIINIRSDELKAIGTYDQPTIDTDNSTDFPA